ncbi:MAG: DUF4159 domain-containing protein [Acidobacteriota bacterium]
MRRVGDRGRGRALIAALLTSLVAIHASAQWRQRAIVRYPEADRSYAEGFVFCRGQYDEVRYEWLGQGWFTDYPDSDVNFMIRLSQLTTVKIQEARGGGPEHIVLRLDDPRLFECPFFFMSDVGTIGISQSEAENLRHYLLSGGFLYVDDFWGSEAFDHWAREIATVLPPEDYPIVDIEPGHGIFTALYDVKEVPQIPSIQYWNMSGGEGTSERGSDTREPHLRGIFDADGRLLVAMTHNTDIADGWEREGESREFFEKFSLTKAYPFGINLVVYSMSH